MNTTTYGRSVAAVIAAVMAAMPLAGCPQPPDTVTVPDVTGMDEASAQDALQDAGLELGQVSEEYSDAVAEGRIIGQSPDTQATVDEGSEVDLVVSLGPEQVTVPDVTGMGRTSAESVLQDAGLQLGSDDSDHSDEVPADHIINQDPSSGTIVEEGGRVGVVVSLGPPEPIDTAWARTFGGTSASSVQQTNDGGYILAGGTNSFGPGDGAMYLVKTDAEGELQWENTFGGEGRARARSIQQTRDGGYILAGNTISFGPGDLAMYLVKTDAEGNAPSEPEP